MRTLGGHGYVHLCLCLCMMSVCVKVHVYAIVCMCTCVCLYMHVSDACIFSLQISLHKRVCLFPTVSKTSSIPKCFFHFLAHQQESLEKYYLPV